MTKDSAAEPAGGGNYISEWFGRRIYPEVRLQSVETLTGANSGVCPFLSEMLSTPTSCWKSVNSRGVCTISSASNRRGKPLKRIRQDWLVCPHRVIHTDLVKQSCARIFDDDADQYPVPVSALRNPLRLDELKTNIREHGRSYIFFQDKLGGEISLSGTQKNPEMSFDITLVEVLPGANGDFRVGRYGIMEVQTMDFHGTYKKAVDALTNALDLHKKDFGRALQANLDWAARGIEGPNIANVFKRTFYQMLIKFQLSSGRAAAGTVLALPRSVWDSWQPFLGAPTLISVDGRFDIIEGSTETTLNSFIRVFDIDSSAGKQKQGKSSAEDELDISPVKIQSFIKVDPETLSRHAFTVVPEEILKNISGTDLILASIRQRVALWWPELTS